MKVFISFLRTEPCQVNLLRENTMTILTMRYVSCNNITLVFCKDHCNLYSVKQFMILGIFICLYLYYFLCFSCMPCSRCYIPDYTCHAPDRTAWRNTRYTIWILFIKSCSLLFIIINILFFLQYLVLQYVHQFMYVHPPW